MKKGNVPRGNSGSIKQRQEKIRQNMVRGRTESTDAEERCLVCYDELSTVCVGKCNHAVVCSLCTARLRIIMKDFNCVMCKTEMEHVFVTKADQIKPFEDFQTWGDVAGPGLLFDARSKMFYEENCKAQKAKINSLQETHCGVAGCQTQEFTDVKSLNVHLRETHQKKVCELCWEHRQVFPMENTRYSLKQHDKHCKTGEADSAFSGHPTCGFCHTRHYNEDHLYQHLKEKHEHCHVCAKLGRQHEYYRDGQALSIHFSKEHFVCTQPSCQEAKFIVFATDLELRGHMVANHPELGIDRRVPVNFTIKRRVGHNAADEEPAEGNMNFNGDVLSFTATDFPSMSSQPTHTPTNHGSRYAAATLGHATPGRLDSEQFPSLSSSTPSSSTSNYDTSSFASALNRSGMNNGLTFQYNNSRRNDSQKKAAPFLTREQIISSQMGNSLASSYAPPPTPATNDSSNKKMIRLQQFVKFIVKDDTVKFNKFRDLTSRVWSRQISCSGYCNALGDMFTIDEIESFFPMLLGALPDASAELEGIYKGTGTAGMKALNISDAGQSDQWAKVGSKSAASSDQSGQWAKPRNTSATPSDRATRSGEEDFPSLPIGPKKATGISGWDAFQKSNTPVVVGIGKPKQKKKKKKQKPIDNEFIYA